MGPKNTAARPTDVYLVMMEFDPEYDRLRRDRNAASELEKYVSNKHDVLLQRALEAGTYKKCFSWVIVDGFAAEITSDQAEMLRSADGVRVVEKNQEIGL